MLNQPFAREIHAGLGSRVIDGCECGGLANPMTVDDGYRGWRIERCLGLSGRTYDHRIEDDAGLH
jgi:hypothetical protein